MKLDLHLIIPKANFQGHIDGCLFDRLLWHILPWTNHEGDFCVCEAKLRTKAEHDMFGFEKQKWVESVCLQIVNSGGSLSMTAMFS